MSEQYEPLNVRGMPLVYTCRGCGAVVRNMARHDEWHARQAPAGTTISDEAVTDAPDLMAQLQKQQLDDFIARERAKLAAVTNDEVAWTFYPPTPRDDPAAYAPYWVRLTDLTGRAEPSTETPGQPGEDPTGHAAEAKELPCCEGGPQWGHAWNCPKCPD
jgi:hypothetical protein